VSSWKTVLTGGMRRSVCRVWLVTYHGAFVICRRIFVWYRWITAKLEAAVQYIPIVQVHTSILVKAELSMVWSTVVLYTTQSGFNKNCKTMEPVWPQYDHPPLRPVLSPSSILPPPLAHSRDKIFGASFKSDIVAGFWFFRNFISVKPCNLQCRQSNSICTR
jgi:hypothetical protein